MSGDNEEWQLVHQGNVADIYLHSSCIKELNKLPKKDMPRLESTFKDFFGDMEDLSAIPKGRFNPSEGTHRGQKLVAMKGGDNRVYGAIGSVDGKRAFFGSRAAKKEKNKANSNDLSVSRDRLDSVDGIEGSKL